MKEEAPRRSVRDLIADTVPFWIILVALVPYGLSVPHTASTFDKLTPGWGWIAPIGVECGRLYSIVHSTGKVSRFCAGVSFVVRWWHPRDLPIQRHNPDWAVDNVHPCLWFSYSRRMFSIITCPSLSPNPHRNLVLGKFRPILTLSAGTTSGLVTVRISHSGYPESTNYRYSSTPRFRTLSYE
jgi:hypothetical protein